MKDRNDILRKVQAILSKTKEGAGTTEAEAKSAMAFAHDLMMKHQIQETELSGDRGQDPLEVARRTAYSRSSVYTAHTRMMVWEGQLAMIIADLVGTINTYVGGQVTKRTSSGAIDIGLKGNPINCTEIIFYGPTEDVEDACALHLEWAETIAALARVRYGTPVRGAGRSYAEGFITALRQSVKLVQSALLDTVNTSTALVIVEEKGLMAAKRKQASKWLSEEHGIKLRNRSANRACGNDMGAFSEGKRHGTKADLKRTRQSGQGKIQ